MKVAAYQAPLAVCYSSDVVARIREEVSRCESDGVEILCCPEGVLGGLADYAEDPQQTAMDVGAGELARVLAPLASRTVTTIIGFTERGRAGNLYNAAAVLHRGSVLGVYRKHHPAINRSVYGPGRALPVFTVGRLTFGIIICLDSTFAEPASSLVALGSKVLFIPSNNGLPPNKGGPHLVGEARARDRHLAKCHGVHVIRADVTGCHGQLAAHGSSAIVAPGGQVLAESNPGEDGLVIASVTAAE